MAPPKPRATQPGNSGWTLAAVIGVILLGIYGISQCSGDTSGSNVTDMMNAANADMGNAIAAQTPPPVEPLNAASVSRGTSHLRLAFSAEGFSGAMVYSQNCYDALTRTFTWAKLDQCGGFDMLAVRSIEGADTAALNSEQAYFQSEAAAGRYLAAATGAGQPATEADTRLSQLQRRAARGRTVGRRPPSANDDSGEEDANASAASEAANRAVIYPDDFGPGE